MAWDLIRSLTQGLAPAIHAIFSPQTVIAATQRQNEIDRIAAQFEMQAAGQQFQAAMEAVRQKHSQEIEAYRQYCEDVRLQKRLDSEREQLARRFQHEERLEQYRRETQLILAQCQLQATLSIADHKEIREKFPLKTPAKVILDFYNNYRGSNKPIPLLVIISPPGLELEKFPNAANGFSRIEARLIDEVQDFCKHYPISSLSQPIKYQGADWESKYAYGKSAVDTLHYVLKSVPTVVLESKIDGDLLRIYLAGWDMMEEAPHYEKVLTIPWKEVLYPIARKYASEWRDYRLTLLEKGKSLEEIKRRGGDDELNLLTLEEEEEDREFCRSGEHDYPYLVNKDKYIQELAQFLGICHCILVGLVADRYHFSHADARPKLPELLPGLLVRVPSDSLQELLIEEIVSSYQSLYQSIEGERPHLVPDLVLDLALSLSFLSDKSWARKQVESSINAWLKLRNRVASVEGEKSGFLELESLLEAVKSALTVGDKEYVEKLIGCLGAIGESRYQEMIRGVWEEIKSQQKAEREGQQEAERKRKLENASVAYTLTGHFLNVTSLAISPDGQTLVSSGIVDKAIKIWSLSTGQELRTLTTTDHSHGVASLAISPDGQTLVSGGSYKDHTIKIWQLTTGQELRTLTGHCQGQGVHSLAISPDGQTLISGSLDHTIKIWQLSTGRELRTLTPHCGSILSLAISPDGQTLVSGSYEGIIKIWQLSTGREIRTLTAHSGPVLSLAISPDGQTLVSCTSNLIANDLVNTIKIWQLSTGYILHNFTGHRYRVVCLAITPDGQTLISGGDDRIKIWQLNTGQELHNLNGDSKFVESVAISLDGQTLVSGGGDGIKIWRVA